MSKKVLFVCLGNICRSPLAQGIAEARAVDLGVDVSFDSAGTGAWHINDHPDPRAVVAARTRGYEVSGQVARRVTKQDFDEFDLIIGMDQKNLNDLKALQPSSSTAKLHLLSDFLDEHSSRDIADPYYTGRFLPVIDQIEAAMSGLLDQFRELAQ